MIVIGESELAKLANDHVGIEDPHHDLLAERGRHRGDPELDFGAVRRHCLDPSILRPAALDDLHPRQQLDPRHHRDQHRRWNLVRLVEHAVDAEADNPFVATRLEMNVRRALVECVLPQPVDDVDDVAVVRIERPLRAQLDQLLEVRRDRPILDLHLPRALDRLREVVELGEEPIDVERIGEDQLDVQMQDLLELVGPCANERLRRCHEQLVLVHGDRQDPIALGICVTDHLRDGREVDLQRIDVRVRDFELARQPLSQPLEMQDPMRRLSRAELEIGNQHQGMLVATVARTAEELVGLLGSDQAVGLHQLDDVVELETAIGTALGRGLSRRKRCYRRLGRRASRSALAGGCGRGSSRWVRHAGIITPNGAITSGVTSPKRASARSPS